MSRKKAVPFTSNPAALALTMVVFIIVLATLTLLFVNSIQTKTLSTQSSAALTRPQPSSYGVITPPDSCTHVYIPVCGADGRTYSNECVAKQSRQVLDCKGACPCKTVAYFRFTDTARKYFIIKLTDPIKIAQARTIISKKQSKILNGVISKQKAVYNPAWSYVYEPMSIEFADFAAEVCDGNMQYIQDHLSEVGGSFLPGNRWCPWTSRMVDEVTTAVTTTLR